MYYSLLGNVNALNIQQLEPYCKVLLNKQTLNRTLFFTLVLVLCY